jgi:glucose dehydrogenase
MNTILTLLALVAIGWLFIKIAKAGLYAAIGVGVVSFGWAVWYFGTYFREVVTGAILVLCFIGLYYAFKHHPDNEVKDVEAAPAPPATPARIQDVDPNTVHFPKDLPEGTGADQQQ